MKVKYPISFTINNNNDVVKFEYSTGEIVGFIPGNVSFPDRFMVCDDKSGAFIKVNVDECYKVEDDVDS